MPLESQTYGVATRTFRPMSTPPHFTPVHTPQQGLSIQAGLHLERRNISYRAGNRATIRHSSIP
jgi:hypothetical protein